MSRQLRAASPTDRPPFRVLESILLSRCSLPRTRPPVGSSKHRRLNRRQILVWSHGVCPELIISGHDVCFLGSLLPGPSPPTGVQWGDQRTAEPTLPPSHPQFWLLHEWNRMAIRAPEGEMRKLLPAPLCTVVGLPPTNAH